VTSVCAILRRVPADPRVLRFWYETEVLALPRVPVTSGPLPAGPGDDPGSPAARLRAPLTATGSAAELDRGWAEEYVPPNGIR